MKTRFRVISLIVSMLLVASMLSGCSSKAIEAAKRIESSIQKRQAKAKSFININADSIDAQNAMNIIEELASEKYKGRKPGTKENEAALDYISHQFRSIGLKNPDGLENYMQHYYQRATLLKEAPMLELLDRDGKAIKSFEYPKNFVFYRVSDSTEDIDIKAPMQVINDVVDLSKKTFTQHEVLLFSIKAQGRYTREGLMSVMYDTSAAAIIVEVDVNSENKSYSDLPVIPLYNKSWGENYKPIITVDSVTYVELAQAALEQKQISLRCSYTIEESYKAANIVGYIPGIDEKLKDNYIIIGGHMDHVGDNMNGTYNPGALDNASGTAAMIEIARIISENNIRPRKTLVFIAFNSEEDGNGSPYYAAEPVFPLKNAVMINLDMVGSSAVTPISVAVWSRHNTELRSEFLELGKSLGIDVEESDNGSSDHSSFGEKGVPSVMLSNMDVKSGYHSPNDTIADIDKDHLKQVIELVLHYIDKKAY